MYIVVEVEKIERDIAGRKWSDEKELALSEKAANEIN